ncbi:MAG: response regulator [Patescibacteria group bacterium]
MPEKSTNILVVEDEEMMRKALRDELTQAGFSVSEAKDGEEGLAKALGEHPDLILLDLRMPKMDGLEVMRRLRKDPWGKGASIIWLTVSAVDDKMLKEVQTLEPAYYLSKGRVTLEEVVAKVRERLGIK